MSLTSNVFERAFNYHLIAHRILLFIAFQLGKIFSSGKLLILSVGYISCSLLSFMPSRPNHYFYHISASCRVGFLRYPRTSMLLSPLFVYLLVFGFTLMLDTFADQAWAKHLVASRIQRKSPCRALVNCLRSV